MSKVKSMIKSFLPKRVMEALIKFKIWCSYDIKLKYKAKKESWTIKCRFTWECRGEKTCELLVDALRQSKKQLVNDFKITICTADYPQFDKRMLAYSKGNFKNVIMIPDFSFVDWKECGIENYDEVCSEIYEKSKKPPIYEKLFWIGNASTHPTRQLLYEMAKNNSDMEVVAMNWRINEDGKQMANQYVSLPDHTKYKWLIDIQGAGWSARTKLLMFSGRTLFLVDRKWKDYWWGDEVKPFEHFIPVKEDLSDLEEKLEWAKNHPKEAASIAENAQSYALKHLRRQNAVDYMSKVLIQLSEG